METTPKGVKFWADNYFDARNLKIGINFQLTHSWPMLPFLITLVTPERGYKIVALTRNGLNFHQFRGNRFVRKYSRMDQVKLKYIWLSFFAKIVNGLWFTWEIRNQFFFLKRFVRRLKKQIDQDTNLFLQKSRTVPIYVNFKHFV